MKNQKGNVIAGLIVFVIVGFLAIIVISQFTAVIKLEGNEVGVIQDWSGVKDKLMLPGTHVYNNFVNDIYKYNIGTQKITFDNKQNPDSEYDPIQVEVGENGGQKAWVAISVNYHVSSDKIVILHKQGIGKTYESVVLKREIMDTVNEIARPHKSALDLYSGAGFVEFKNRVADALEENKVLIERGIVVETVMLSNVHLDPGYEQEIAQKQVAQQQALRKIEETKAAEQEAKRIFAMSQAQVEQARQIAEAKKITEVTDAEAKARKTVLDAEAERDSNLARASGELAIGKARAEIKQLDSASLYAGEAGLRRAEVEVAVKRAEILRGMFNGVKIIGEKTVLSIMDENSKGNVIVSTQN